MPGVDYRVVRARIGIGDVLRLIDYEPLSDRNGQLRGPCPIHGSQSSGSRSFSVNVKANAFRCFSCGTAGNQLDLWSALRNLSLHRAAVDLCDQMNVEVPWIDEV